MRALKRCEVLSAGRRHRRPLRKRVGKVLFEVVEEFKRGEGGVKQTHASADGHVLARGGSSKKVKKKNEPTNDDGTADVQGRTACASSQPAAVEGSIQKHLRHYCFWLVV